jgi:methionyl-tRNA formyltransferase
MGAGSVSPPRAIVAFRGECLIEAVKKVHTNDATFISQDEALASFAPKISKEMSLVKWVQSASQIHNQIRALKPWPIAYTHLGGELLKIHGSEPADLISSDPGSILTDSKSFLRISCGDKRALALTELQLENRKRLNVREFLKAYRGHFPFERMG